MAVISEKKCSKHDRTFLRTGFRFSPNRAVSGQFCSEMTKDNRQVTWRFLRRLLTLYVDAGGGHGLSLEQTERLFQLCATSDEHVLEVRTETVNSTRGIRLIMSSTQNNEQGGIFCADFRVNDR